MANDLVPKTITITPEILNEVSHYSREYNGLPCAYKQWIDQIGLKSTGTKLRNLTQPIQSVGDVFDKTILARLLQKYGNQCNQYGYVIGNSLRLLGRGAATFIPRFLDGELYCRVDIGAVVVVITEGTMLSEYTISQVIKMTDRRHMVVCIIGPVYVTIHELPEPLVQLIESQVDKLDPHVLQAYCQEHEYVISVMEVRYHKQFIDCTGMFVSKEL